MSTGRGDLAALRAHRACPIVLLGLEIVEKQKPGTAVDSILCDIEKALRDRGTVADLRAATLLREIISIPNRKPPAPKLEYTYKEEPHPQMGKCYVVYDPGRYLTCRCYLEGEAVLVCAALNAKLPQ